jgi:hypothetical protein
MFRPQWKPIFDCPREHTASREGGHAVVPPAKAQACHHHNLKIVNTLYSTSE